MGLRLEVRVQGLEAMKVVTEELPGIARRRIGLQTQTAAFQLENAVRRRLSGPPSGTRLGVRTGALRRSWVAEKIETGRWRVASGLPYNLIHEFGGPIKRGGRVVGQMPVRPFLAPALKDWEPLAAKIFADEIDEVAEEATKIVERLRGEGFTLKAGAVGG
jgi:hypothetical protein